MLNIAVLCYFVFVFIVLELLYLLPFYYPGINKHVDTPDLDVDFLTTNQFILLLTPKSGRVFYFFFFIPIFTIATKSQP